MIEQIDAIRKDLDRLRLYYLKNNIETVIHESQIEGMTNLEFIKYILNKEIQQRDERDFSRRLKSARLSTDYNLDIFNHDFGGITKYQLKELRELVWMENAYNLILMGPSGTGKTYIASGLIYDAIKNGYKAYLITMEELVNIIRLKPISSSAMTKYNKLLKAHLIAIDDIMLMPINKEETTGFFNLINALHEKTSIIITTNKAPTEWTETMPDEVATTAILDRLLYKCEVVKLTGSSYRIENRKTIFDEDNNPNRNIKNKNY